MTAADLPAAVRAMAGRGPDWAAWVDALPATRDVLVAEWELRHDGAARYGYCSLVLPVRDRDNQPAMLKIGFPDDESEHEHLALRHWGGRAAVTLRRADPRRRALLLERLPDRSLATVPAPEACAAVGAMYSELHVPPPPPLRRLPDLLRRWAEQLGQLPASAPVPHRLVRQAQALASELADDPGPAALLHGDLHYDNVLAGGGQPWLAIDPKPLAGDPNFEPAPMLWNRWDELAGDIRGGVRRRLHILVEAAGLDADRARDYVVVRLMHNAAERLADPPGTRRLTPTADYLTMCVAIVKSVQD